MAVRKVEGRGIFPPYPTQRLTQFAVDFGGVLEYYPSHRSVIRFDLGALAARYRPVRFLTPISTLFATGSFTQNGFNDVGMQFMTGFGWRF